MPDFEHDGHRLHYEVHGEGPRVLVYLHGLLLDAALNRDLARRLAEHGHRVVLLDLLGHGSSDRPTHAYHHRTELYAEQVVALLDHLELDEAVLGGVSLGANVTLTAAAARPERVRGMVLEMPVLERGAMAALVAFFPLLMSLRFARPLWWPIRRIVGALPRTGTPLDSFLNTLASDPREMSAVIHGVFFGSSAPGYRDRRRLDIPTLVVGHTLDLLHPMSDATALATELPDARSVRAWSALEARTLPDRIVGEIAAFLAEAWGPTAARHVS